MIPATTERIRSRTSEDFNDCITERTRENVARFAAASPQTLERRLDELQNEWDVERMTAAVNGAGILAGSLLAAAVNPLWLLIPTAFGACLLVHALLGWTPALPLFRRMGVRTACEIAHERYALKALRGDFLGLEVAVTPQDREDLIRLEGEGGIAADPGPDASSPKIVNEAMRAVRS